MCTKNIIGLPQERWEHIIDDTNHTEMEAYEDHLKITIKNGKRKQEPLNPRKYRYYHRFDDLPDDANHIIAVVLFGYNFDENGDIISNNYVLTAFFKHIYFKR